jgi:WD40 repeat protein
MEKDHGHRYESASALARDVNRHLRDEPVSTCPPSAGYRLRKFVRRHRGPVLAASLVVLALLGGMVDSTIGMVQARRERDVRDRALQREQQIAYSRQVALAHRELEANLVGRADQLLEECQVRLRGWESYILKRLRYGGLPPFEGHGDTVRGVVLRVDGRLVASASPDRTIRIWEAVTGPCLLTLKSDAAVAGVAFSPDSRHLASASLDATVKVWDMATGRELRTLRGHSGMVWCVAFSPTAPSWSRAAGITAPG